MTNTLTQKEALLKMFRANGNRLTLGQIMRTQYCCEYRARFTELRQEGYAIGYTKGARPSENLYILTEKLKYDEVGQAMFV